MSAFCEALKSKRLTVTAEFLPPRGADPAAIRRIAAALPGSLSAVVVSENHEEIRACALACAALLKQDGIESILPLVTRDRNRIALQSDALGAALLGITNLLCVSGDHQSLGVSPQAAGAFDMDPTQVLLALKGLRDDGALMDGQRVSPPPAFCLGAIAHPHLAPAKLNLLQMEKKAAAGAQFLITQPVWDAAGFAAWMEQVRGAGLHGKIAILAGVKLLSSAAGAAESSRRHAAAPVPEAVRERIGRAADPAKEGIAICAELAAAAAGIEGVRGVHLLAGGREDALAAVLQQAGLPHA